MRVSIKCSTTFVVCREFYRTLKKRVERYMKDNNLVSLTLNVLHTCGFDSRLVFFSTIRTGLSLNYIVSVGGQGLG